MKIYRIPMVPGPVSVSREVLEAGQENFGSADLEKEYIDLYKATEKSLRKIMQTKNSVVIQTGEGMLALWSALKSCLLPGDKVLVLSTGLFGYGMGGMAEAIGCEVRTVGFGFDETFTDFDLIEKAIREFQPKMITMVQNETPSGTPFSWWGGDSRHEATEKAIEAFQAKYEGVTVSPEYGAWSGWEEKQSLNILGGNSADLM